MSGRRRPGGSLRGGGPCIASGGGPGLTLRWIFPARTAATIAGTDGRAALHDAVAKPNCGGIDLNFPLPKLLASIDGYLARGHNGVKIKIGQPDLADDIARIKAIRERIGPDIAFMVDANYSLDTETAIRAARAFEPFDLTWFEEPIDPDDLDGYARIHSETGFPLAAGENAHSVHDFNLLCKTGALSFLQPDVATCGGITTWLRAADIAEAHGVSVCSHGMQELHVSLLSGRKDSGWLEVHSFPIDEYTTRPLVIENSLAVAPDTPGIGVVFDWDKLARFRVGK
ncbi:UNVERIFIED_CONTAM: hypothetical protein GTU68_064842 [Idotea baltica]|nr:hypothetical protein [Idotea baltica]